MTDRVVKITTKQPEGSANALTDPAVIRKLRENPLQMRVGIVVFNVPKWENDLDADTEIGKLVSRRFEVIMDDSKGDATALERLLMRAFEARTGATTLDAELEEDVRRAFDGIREETPDE